MNPNDVEITDILEKLAEYEMTIPGVRMAYPYDPGSTGQANMPAFVNWVNPSPTDFFALGRNHIDWRVIAALALRPVTADLLPKELIRYGYSFVRPTLGVFAAHLKLGNLINGSIQGVVVYPAIALDILGTKAATVQFEIRIKQLYAITVGA
jgi:hypothetical protein